MKTTYTIETKHQFIQLRARDISLGKIAEQLDVPKSTLGTWNQDFEPEINRLRRLEWEEVEAQFANSVTDDLKRILTRIRAAEDELDKRQLKYFDMRELFQLIRESRREYDRKRALLMADPPAKRDKPPNPQRMEFQLQMNPLTNLNWTNPYDSTKIVQLNPAIPTTYNNPQRSRPIPPNPTTARSSSAPTNRQAPSHNGAASNPTSLMLQACHQLTPDEH